MSTYDFEILAKQAIEALLQQKLMTIRIEPNTERNGFPLPTKRMPPQEDGSVIQDYRPLAVLEFIHEELTGEKKSKEVRDRLAIQEDKKNRLNSQD